MSPTESHRFRWGALLVGCIVVTRIGGRTPIWSSRPAHATTVGLLAHISVHGGSLRTARMSHAAQPRPNGRTRVFRHYDAPTPTHIAKSARAAGKLSRTLAVTNP